MFNINWFSWTFRKRQGSVAFSNFTELLLCVGYINKANDSLNFFFFFAHNTSPTLMWIFSFFPQLSQYSLLSYPNTALLLIHSRYKSLLNEIKDLNNWRNILCSQIRRLNILNMVMLPNVFYRLNAIPIRSSTDFIEIDMLILKFIGNCKGPTIAKTILKKKNKVGGLTYPDFKS